MAARQLRLEHFDGHPTVQPGVLAYEDVGHPADGDLLLDGILGRQGASGILRVPTARAGETS